MKRIDALRLMDQREAPGSASRHIYALQFYTKDGRLIDLPHCYTTGLRASMKKNRLRGIQPCDKEGLPTGHIIAASIDLLRAYNGQPITL